MTGRTVFRSMALTAALVLATALGAPGALA
jgi:hypothetical protein